MRLLDLVGVQDQVAALLRAGDELRRWVEGSHGDGSGNSNNNGAAIYVCGSLQGMARGVDDALRQVLGSATLDALLVQGRYRRDVY